MFAFLPLKIFEVNLRWLETGEMPFFHQPLVNAFMRHLLGSPENYEQCWAIHTPESGQLHYATGDWYRFYCIALPRSSTGVSDSTNSAFGYSSQAQFFDQLSKLPNGDFVHKMRGQFGGHFELVSIRDALTQQSLGSPEQAMQIDEGTIEHEAQQWCALQPKSLVLEFLSPIRLSMPKSRGKGEQGVVRHPQQFDPNMLFMRLVQAIQQLHNVQTDKEQTDKEQANKEFKPQRLPFCEQPDWLLDNTSKSTQLFWADCGYQSLQGENKTLGGLCGAIRLNLNTPLNLQQWQYLIVGQYLGIGLSRGLGFGRYRLITKAHTKEHLKNQGSQSTLLPFTRANSLYQQIIAGERIHSVWQDELRKLSDKQRYQWQGEEAVTDLIQAVHQPDYAYRYQPQPLHPVLIDEETPKPRMLLLPAFRDKVLQKSASLWLGETLDSLYSYASYGYRKGRSRLTVKDKVQQAWREGYRWVVDADIRSFFQTVDINQLLHKLEALYGSDPLWALIQSWLNTPINRDKLPQGYEDFQLKGLPLGSAISPVLANLMLDDFDADMEDHQLQLIRFADDFIILCKTKEQAEHAMVKVQASLMESGFELNQNKTRITSFAKGFHFLGYFFFNDIVLESKPGQQETVDATTSTPSKPVSSQGLQHHYYLGEDNTTGVIVSIVGEVAYLHSAEHHLQVSRDDDVKADIPWSHINQILLFGAHQITTPALRKAMQLNIPVHFADGFGKYQGIANSAKPETGQGLWLAQIAQFSDEERRLHFSRGLMRAKIASQYGLLRKRLDNLRKHANRSSKDQNTLTKTREALKSAIKKLEQAELEVGSTRNIEHLLGLEGRAAALYWQAFSLLVEDKWGFNSRNKNPPRDPVNALLSYGYSMLYSFVDTTIRSAGLYPWLGGYHHMRNDHKALASDLMEPFRFHIDNLVLTVINKYTATYHPESFKQQGNKVLMNTDIRKHWSHALLNLLQKPIVQEYANLTQPVEDLELSESNANSILGEVMAQNQRLVRWIRNDVERFSAYQRLSVNKQY